MASSPPIYTPDHPPPVPAAAQHPSTPSKTPYLVAISGMAALSVIAILGIMLVRPGQDNAATISMALAAIGLATGQVLSILKSDEAVRVGIETRASVNSQLDQWKKDFGNLAYRKGGADAEMLAGIAAAAAAATSATLVASLKAELMAAKVATATLVGAAGQGAYAAPVVPIPVVVQNPPDTPVPVVDIKTKVDKP